MYYVQQIPITAFELPIVRWVVYSECLHAHLFMTIVYLLLGKGAEIRCQQYLCLQPLWKTINVDSELFHLRLACTTVLSDLPAV